MNLESMPLQKVVNLAKIHYLTINRISPEGEKSGQWFGRYYGYYNSIRIEASTDDLIKRIWFHEVIHALDFATFGNFMDKRSSEIIACTLGDWLCIKFGLVCEDFRRIIRVYPKDYPKKPRNKREIKKRIVLLKKILKSNLK